MDIRLNDGGGLRERLSQAMLKDLERDSSRNPIVLNYLPSIDSIEIADRATEAFGKSPELSNSIPGIVGAIHFLGCEREEACSSAQIQWERALRQDSEDWAARLGLARIYLRKGDWEMARTHIDPVLNLISMLAPSLAHLKSPSCLTYTRPLLCYCAPVVFWVHLGSPMWLI